ncbi:MAG: potassium transporter TrkA [Candidatus Omnitrophica bacterium]|nr:potassium transporter TrkA [Candidatus Omnitrophota bacterium]
MNNLIYVIPVVLIIAISAIVVRIASIALKMTGLDEKKAYFQAMSAFTGTGFTTKDSELMLQNPTRRKIIIFLMILGNAGIITVITALVISFARSDIVPVITNVAIILALTFFLFMILSHKGVTKFLNSKIESSLEKNPPFAKRPVEEILRVAQNYGIAEVNIKNDCQDMGKTLNESSFRERDILILAINRKNAVIPTPKASDRILPDDTLICYGKLSNIERIMKKE